MNHIDNLVINFGGKTEGLIPKLNEKFPKNLHLKLYDKQNKDDLTNEERLQLKNVDINTRIYIVAHSEIDLQDEIYGYNNIEAYQNKTFYNFQFVLKKNY